MKMNERDTINVTMPNYRIDDSKEKAVNIANYQRNVSQERDYQKEPEKKEANIGLSKTKIININDFIFRQYLEFYPELKGLSCKDNVLYLQENGEVIEKETLTFDLRTLPGEAWNVNAKEFMEIIKINKSCAKLENFISYNPDMEILENNVTNYMNLYFSVKDSFRYLTEDNKMLIGKIELNIAETPKDSPTGKLINQKLDEYFEITKEMGDSKGKGMVLELKNKNLPAVVPEEEQFTRSSKAAFVNIAIIIYGVLNIGIILAIALMK